MKKTCLLFIILLAATFSSFAQNRIRSALDTLQKFYPQEKIYLLYNKAEYLAGETVRFSAFVFAGYGLSPISSNLFVELYDKEKKLLVRKQFPVFNGQSAGQISLPDKLDENIYFIRSYTHWMLNFPEDHQYIHLLKVFNPKSSQKLQLRNSTWKAEAFPEGGKLVDGIATKLAVRMFSSSALPVNWSGYITKEGSNEKIAEFNSLDPNIALTQFIPFAGIKYYVIVEDKSGERQVISLPAVATSGVQLQVNNQNDSIQYIIRFKNIPGGGRGYKLIASINDQLVYEATIKRSDTVLNRFIQTTFLFNGILRLTLFDENDILLAERLCFVKPTLLEIIKPAFLEKELNPGSRSFNSVQLKSDTAENFYSVLVQDVAANDPAKDENFLTAVWLTNDISRPVENPAQYFNDPGPAAAEALDALLISETWKGISWEDILNGRWPLIKNWNDNYISFKGTVYRNKKLVAREPVNLVFFFADSSNQFIPVTTDSTGSFMLQNLFFYDTARVYYQMNQTKNSAKNIRIQFEPLIFPAPYLSSFPVTAYTLVNRQAGDQLEASVVRSLNTMNNEKMADSRYKTLEEVKVRTSIRKAKELLDEELSSPSFRSINETIFDFVHEDQHAQGYSNILQWLQGRVAGLYITYNNGVPTPVIRGEGVSIYIDEMPIDPGFLNGMSVNDIAMIKVIKGFFVGGFGGGGNGAIAIYTRKGNMRSKNMEPSLNNGLLKGYDKIENFSSFDSNENINRLVKTDLRDVLFWNPVAVPDEEMKVPVRFYNNDSAKEFRLIIAGFTIEGKPVYYNGLLK